MAAYSVQTISRSGLSPTFTAVASSDTFVNPSDSRTYLEVINAGGSPSVVTVNPVQATIQTGIAGDVGIDPISVSVPATTGRRKIGPFPPAYVSAGVVTVGYSFLTSVTAGAFRLPNN